VTGSAENIYASMISMKQLTDWNELIPAEQSLYLLDACFSGLAGAAPKSNVDYSKITIRQLAKKSSHILTAGTADGEAIVLDSLGGSLFTHAVIDGLRGQADASSGFPNDGIVSVTELSNYVKTRVAIGADQAGWRKSLTPQIGLLSASTGEFFFPVRARPTFPDRNVDLGRSSNAHVQVVAKSTDPFRSDERPPPDGFTLSFGAEMDYVSAGAPRDVAARYGKGRLRQLRNSPYAKHGYIFKSDDLFRYFSQFDWYVPRHVDAQTAYDRMTDTERELVLRIQQAERLAR